MKKLLFLVLAISLFSCSNNDDAPQTTPPTNEVAYFKGSLNGIAINYVDDGTLNTAYYNGGSVGYVGIGTDRSHYYLSDMSPFSNTVENPKIGISFDNMYITQDSDMETAAFFGLFNPAPTNFITQTQQSNGVKGCFVRYYSPDGTYYTSLGGNQTGSSIVITNKTEVTSPSGLGDVKSVTLTGTVTCKLYNYLDPSSSDIITLTNGTYKLEFQEFLD